MALTIINRSSFGDRVEILYECETAGDELSLHSHTVNHTTRLVAGRIEIFDETGPKLWPSLDDGPVEYVAGRKHGIRALTDRSRFLNVFPIVGHEEESRG